MEGVVLVVAVLVVVVEVVQSQEDRIPMVWND
jgi:hypothetical protein